MDLSSLGLRSSLIFSRFEGIVTDEDDHLAICTPDNPSYRWGNYLFFEHPPRPSDFVRWTRLFEEEIGTPPVIRHRTFAWVGTDASPGAVEPFLAGGYDIEREVVLSTSFLAAPDRRSDELSVRPLSTDAEWDEAVELQIRCNENEPEDGFRDFRVRKMASYRAMQDAGLGFWFGGFVDGSMVADCGLFAKGGLGRYQHVETAPKARRRGFARTLLIDATTYAREHLDIDVLVIHADPDYHAIDLYRSLGFEDAEEIVGMEIKDVS